MYRNDNIVHHTLNEECVAPLSWYVFKQDNMIPSLDQKGLVCLASSINQKSKRSKHINCRLKTIECKIIVNECKVYSTLACLGVKGAVCRQNS